MTGGSWGVGQALKARGVRPFLAVFLLDGTSDLIWWITLAWSASREGGLGSLVLVAVGVLTAVGIFPGGWLASRFGPDRVVRYTLPLRVGMFLSWGIALQVSHATVTLPLLALLAIPLAAVDGAHLPAMETVQLQLLPTEAQSVATGLERLATRTAQLVAAMLATIFTTAPQAAMVSGLLLVFCAPLLGKFASQLTEQDQDQDQDQRPSIFAGIHGVLQDRVLRITVPAHGAYNFLTGGLMLVLLPLLVRREGWGNESYRVIFGAWSVGLLVGTVVALAAPAFPSRGRPAAAMALGAGVGCGGLALAAWVTPSASIVLAAVMGLFSGPIGQLMQGLTRERASQLRDGTAVVAVGTFAVSGLDPLGWLIGSAVAIVSSGRMGFAALSGVIILLGVVVVSQRGLRHLARYSVPVR